MTTHSPGEDSRPRYSSDGAMRYRQMVHLAPIGMHFYRLEDEGRLILEDFNPAANEILGIDHAALLGRPVEEAFPGLVGTEIPDRYREIARTGGIWTDEQTRYENQDHAGVFSVRAYRTSPGHMVAMFTDISDRVRAEGERRREEERLRLILRNSDIVVFDQDTDLRYTTVHNPHPGFREDDVLGKRDEDLLPPDDAERLTAVKSRALETGEVQRAEVRTTIDGQAVYHDLTVAPRRDEDREIVGITCASMDITRRKSLQAQLHQAQKMESVGRLAGGVAHDFNNVLTVVLGNAELVLDDLESAGDIRELLEEIRAAATHARSLTSQLLVFSREKATRPEVIDPNQVIDEMKPMVRRMCGETIECDLELDPDVEADLTGDETVLVVDDDSGVRGVAARALRKLGYTVAEAQDAGTALAEARRLPQLDLLITDFVLPGADGHEVATRLREEHPGLAVLLMSGYSRDKADPDSLGPGTSYLEKPFTPSQLGGRVRSILDGHPARSE